MNYINKDGKFYRKGTLAHYLDRRNTAVNEPTKSDLPDTINPYEVLMSLMGNNACVIKLKHSEMKFPSELLKLVNTLIPSEQAILFYIDVDDVTSKLDLNTRSRVRAGIARECPINVPIKIVTSASVIPLEDKCSE